MNEQLNQSAPSERKFYLDAARAVAILSISMNHAVNRSYENFHHAFFEFYRIPVWSTIIKVIAIIFGHIGVPLFLMISGALLLNKKMENGEDVKRFYKHNLLPIFITTEIWYVIMYFFILAFHRDWSTITPGSLIQGLCSTVLFFNQTTMDSMWYMPMILCVYMVLPYITVALKRIPLKYMILPGMVIYISAMVFPTINDFFQLNYIGLRINLVLRSTNIGSMYLLYVIPGWWVSQGGMKKLRGRYVALGALLSFAACCATAFYYFSRPIDMTVDYNFALLPFLAIFVFELLRREAHKIVKLRRPITYLAKISFAVYFVHILVMSLLEWYFPYQSWYQPLAMVFLEAASIAASLIIVGILSKISFCRKYMFMIKG